MIKTILKIDGMACGMCEAHINDAIRRATVVKKVTSSHRKKETEIISEQALDEGILRQAINNAGYVLLSFTASPYEKRGLFHIS